MKTACSASLVMAALLSGAALAAGNNKIVDRVGKSQIFPIPGGN